MKEAKEGRGTAVSNGQHILREAYAAKRADQLTAVEERRIARAGRTPDEQIALLDKRFGKENGAAKERARLCIEVFDRMKDNGMELLPVTRDALVWDLEIAKMNSRGCHALRRFDLQPRTLYEYEGAKRQAVAVLFEEAQTRGRVVLED